MKLANLVYEIVKDAIEFPSGFNFDGFIRGDYDEDRDFSSQISFAFNYVNLAFARLYTGQKNILKITKKISNENGYIEMKEGEVLAVVDGLKPDYEKVSYHLFMDGIAVEKDYVGKVVYIEYRPLIPHFDMESIREQTWDEDNEVTYKVIDVDLEQYGINEEMCAYVKEYCKGGLLEYLSPDLSNRHVQMAEAYFSNLKTRITEYPIRRIVDRVGSGGAW